MFTRAGQPTSLSCEAVCWGGGCPRGNKAACSTRPVFSHSPRYPQADLAFLVLFPRWVGLCTFWDPGCFSNDISCEAGNSSHRLNTHRCFQSEVWGFISLHWNPGLNGLSQCPVVPSSLSPHKCGITLSASHRLAHPGPPAADLPWVLSARLPISAPPTGLDECFFFNFLVVRLSYSSFSVSSGCFLFLNCCRPSFGCARKQSVSTYASILAGSQNVLY